MNDVITVLTRLNAWKWLKKLGSKPFIYPSNQPSWTNRTYSHSFMHKIQNVSIKP